MYKFKEDGTINIVLSGRVTKGTWEYDPTDKTIIISASDQSYMVHPGMYDDMLLALQVDGTNECSFLIEENNSKNFAPKTYSELLLFFEEKERKALEEEKRIILVKIQEKEREERDIEIQQAFVTFLKDRKISNQFTKEKALFFSVILALSITSIVYFASKRIIAEMCALALTSFLPIYGLTYMISSIFYNKKIIKSLDEFVNLPQYKNKIDDKLLNKLKEANQLK